METVSENNKIRKTGLKGRHITWVWHRRGSNSPESLCEFASFAPVRAAVEVPPAPSPCSIGCNRANERAGIDKKNK